MMKALPLTSRKGTNPQKSTVVAFVAVVPHDEKPPAGTVIGPRLSRGRRFPAM